jgi:hypothetical protein
VEGGLITGTARGMIRHGGGRRPHLFRGPSATTHGSGSPPDSLSATAKQLRGNRLGDDNLNKVHRQQSPIFRLQTAFSYWYQTSRHFSQVLVLFTITVQLLNRPLDPCAIRSKWCCTGDTSASFGVVGTFRPTDHADDLCTFVLYLKDRRT